MHFLTLGFEHRGLGFLQLGAFWGFSCAWHVAGGSWAGGSILVEGHATKGLSFGPDSSTGMVSVGLVFVAENNPASTMGCCNGTFTLYPTSLLYPALFQSSFDTHDDFFFADGLTSAFQITLDFSHGRPVWLLHFRNCRNNNVNF